MMERQHRVRVAVVPPGHGKWQPDRDRCGVNHPGSSSSAHRVECRGGGAAQTQARGVEESPPAAPEFRDDADKGARRRPARDEPQQAALGRAPEAQKAQEASRRPASARPRAFGSQDERRAGTPSGALIAWQMIDDSVRVRECECGRGRRMMDKSILYDFMMSTIL